MEQQTQFQCTGDCLKCSVAQRQYCSCQHSYNSLRIIQEMQESFKAMSGTVEELREKIGVIQNNEALVFDPNGNSAQEGDGAENRLPEIIT